MVGILRMLSLYSLGILFLIVFLLDFPYWKSVFTEPIRLYKIRRGKNE